MTLITVDAQRFGLAAARSSLILILFITRNTKIKKNNHINKYFGNVPRIHPRRKTQMNNVLRQVPQGMGDVEDIRTITNNHFPSRKIMKTTQCSQRALWKGERTTGRDGSKGKRSFGVTKERAPRVFVNKIVLLLLLICVPPEERTQIPITRKRGWDYQSIYKTGI